MRKERCRQQCQRLGTRIWGQLHEQKTNQFRRSWKTMIDLRDRPSVPSQQDKIKALAYLLYWPTIPFWYGARERLLAQHESLLPCCAFERHMPARVLAQPSNTFSNINRIICLKVVLTLQKKRECLRTA